MVKCEGEILKQVQALEIELLQAVQEICKRHNLRYYAIGGTCIGAIRHQGFIPWDDDIDIALPYEDYITLKEKCKTELPEGMEVHDTYDKRENIRFFAKVSMVNTTAIKVPQLNFPDSYEGVHIDIMPIFGLPEDESKHKKICNEIIVYKMKNRLLRYRYSYFSSIPGKLAWIISWPKKLFLPYGYYGKKLEKKYGCIPFDNADKILFAWRPKKNSSYGFIFEYEDFEDIVEMPFENITVAVPKGYDRYLTMDFGDYMKLPPKEKQVGHPWAIIDLNKSYREYIK